MEKKLTAPITYKKRGRKKVLNSYNIERILFYRNQGHTIRRLAADFSVSICTIHKVIHFKY